MAILAAKARRKRTYNLRLIKATWPYTIQEIASLLGIHKNAVSRWMRDGLNADRNQRPFLIRGDELIRFLGARQEKRRTKCALVQFYCFKCRDARNPASGCVFLERQSAGKARLMATCDHCGTRMNKVLGADKLRKIETQSVIIKPASEHINACGEASDKRDLEVQ